MKHSKGPWLLRESDCTRPHEIYPSKKLGAINIPTFGWVEDHSEEATANAHLIVAAPDLLEACEALLDLANEDEVRPRSRDWQLFQALLKKSNAAILAQAAIAKAKGEEK